MKFIELLVVVLVASHSVFLGVHPADNTNVVWGVSPISRQGANCSWSHENDMHVLVQSALFPYEHGILSPPATCEVAVRAGAHIVCVCVCVRVCFYLDGVWSIPLICLMQ